MQIEEIKNNLPTPTIQLNPISYYNFNSTNKRTEKKNTHVKLTQKASENENTKEIEIEDIEIKIKNKYKMLMPAILVEFKDKNFSVEYDRADLKNVKKILCYFC